MPLRERILHMLLLLILRITELFFPRKELIEQQGRGASFVQVPRQPLTLGMLQGV
jgi:hypothetical protein